MPIYTCYLCAGRHAGPFIIFREERGAFGTIRLERRRRSRAKSSRRLPGMKRRALSPLFGDCPGSHDAKNFFYFFTYLCKGL